MCEDGGLLIITQLYPLSSVHRNGILYFFSQRRGGDVSQNKNSDAMR